MHGKRVEYEFATTTIWVSYNRKVNNTECGKTCPDM